MHQPCVFVLLPMLSTLVEAFVVRHPLIPRRRPPGDYFSLQSHGWPPGKVAHWEGIACHLSRAALGDIRLDKGFNVTAYTRTAAFTPSDESVAQTSSASALIQAIDDDDHLNEMSERFSVSPTQVMGVWVDQALRGMREAEQVKGRSDGGIHVVSDSPASRWEKHQTANMLESEGPAPTVGFPANVNNLVSQRTIQSRGYRTKLSNLGVFVRQQDSEADSDDKRQIRCEHQDTVFGQSQTQSESICVCSCFIVRGDLNYTFPSPGNPIISDGENISQDFAVALRAPDAAVAVDTQIQSSPRIEERNDTMSLFPKQLLTLATTLIGGAAVLSKTPVWINFFQSLAEIKANVVAPDDFWSAVNFWLFFAVAHAVLQPILWFAELLHASPGPKLADLVPISFLAGNAVLVYVLQSSKEIRNALHIAVFAAFLTYVGAGLAGTAGLGDFNMAFDDSYKGQIVKGCPTYDQVRQPSMEGFEFNKFLGLWYQQKFHDWTQFKETYDTTFEITLTKDGRGWVDHFAVKGPTPESAPRSWHAGTVANGADYFSFGQFDDRDPPGMTREKAFGVEFPNYIVDVQKDPITGQYTEAIQFQCLERGGVRVFEGINFMSRKELMTESELEAMHARAEKAGLYPYGAAPEQMHTVTRRPSTAPKIDNEWQALWRAIGIDRLLELLTKAIEDGDR